MISRTVLASVFAASILATAACGDDTSSDDDGTGNSGAGNAGNTGNTGNGGTGGSASLDVEEALDALAALVNLVDAQTIAAEFCAAVDANPNYTSNTIFSTGGKQAFAGLIRGAYGESPTLQEFVQTSGYWAEAGEPMTPDAVITQTDNSCATNVGFINAVCFTTGPQYTSGGSYIASEAVNTGGCDEAKL